MLYESLDDNPIIPSILKFRKNERELKTKFIELLFLYFSITLYSSDFYE